MFILLFLISISFLFSSQSATTLNLWKFKSNKAYNSGEMNLENQHLWARNFQESVPFNGKYCAHYRSHGGGGGGGGLVIKCSTYF